VYASFAVANLHGIDVEAPAQLIRQRSAGGSDADKSGFEDAIKTTFHDDQVRFRIDTRGQAPSGMKIDDRSRAIWIRKLGDPKDRKDPWSIFRAKDPWSIFRAAAIASGSFPAAFPPVHIERRREEYGRLWPRDLERDELDEFRFAYVDGGTFRNEPLREAIELAALCDEGVAPDSFERVFILIDPSVSGSGEVRSLDFEHALALATKYKDGGSAIDEHELTRRGYAGLLVSVLGRVVMMIKGQSAFRDWLRAAKFNSRVEWEKKLTQIIAELARNGTPALLSDARKMLEEIYLDKAARGPASDADAATKARAARRRDEDLNKLRNELGPQTSDLALVLTLAIRNAAGLRRKRRLNMIAISPWSVPDPPIALAGNFLANFGGFFRKGWREFDYDAGRFAAHHMLTLKIGSGVDRLILDNAPRPVARPTMHSDPRFRNVDPDVRERFMDVLREHVENIANEALGVPNFIDDALSRFVKPKIESAIGAPAVTSRHIVVRITGRIRNDYALKKSKTGSTGYPVDIPGGSRVLETVVEVREQQDQKKPKRYSLVGPHVLLPDGDSPQIRVMRDTFFTTEKRELTIRLNGEAEDWFKVAERRRLLEIKWERGSSNELARRPGDLASFA
jgi:hypothetical protein